MNTTAPTLSFSLQQLPPEAAHFCLGIERFITQELGLDLQDKGIVVALSGGADSKALLLILHILAPRLGFSLYAAHLNHKLRPSAAAEAASARAFAESLGIVFYEESEDVDALAKAGKCGLEEAGRLARRFCTERIRQASGSQWIALGHQLDDLAEDQLMRLLRGAGWPALAGMVAVDEKIHIMRPLLLTPRSELENLLRSLELDWATDETNYDTSFLRNRVRHNFMPLFMAENPSFLETAADLWRCARLDSDFFENTLPTVNITLQNDLFLSKELLSSMPTSLRMRLYKRSLEQLGTGQPLLKNLFALDKSWQSGQGGKSIQFPGNKEATIKEGGILFHIPVKDKKVLL